MENCLTKVQSRHSYMWFTLDKYFSFKHMDALKFKTFLTQEFLKKGFLANTSFYASTAHNKNIIDNYSEVLEEVFKLEKCINGELKIDNLLDGEVSHNGFKRLN